MNSIRMLVAILSITVFALCPGKATAQPAETYPNKPIKLIITNPPGAGNDTLGRFFAQKLSDQLKQPFVIENRPGANGIPGAEYVSRSVPDGYTLLLGNTATLAILVSLFPKLPYDPQRDFTPISVLAISSSVLVVHPSLAVRSVGELVALAKANPGKLNYASPGNGSPFHLSAELFKARTGTDAVHIIYKGTGPALVDLLAGRVQLMFVNVLTVLPHINSGKLRPIASTGAKRLPLLPDVPTMAEAGIRNAESFAWFVLVAPRQTPKEVIYRLNAEVIKAGKQSDVRQRFNEIGLEPIGDLVGNSPEESETFIRSETTKWAKVIKDSGVKVDD